MLCKRKSREEGGEGQMQGLGQSSQNRTWLPCGVSLGHKSAEAISLFLRRHKTNCLVFIHSFNIPTHSFIHSIRAGRSNDWDLQPGNRGHVLGGIHAHGRANDSFKVREGSSRNLTELGQLN